MFFYQGELLVAQLFNSQAVDTRFECDVPSRALRKANNQMCVGLGSGAASSVAFCANGMSLIANISGLRVSPTIIWSEERIVVRVPPSDKGLGTTRRVGHKHTMKKVRNATRRWAARHRLQSVESLRMA